ncbi:hypothetical protein [Methanogenium cariaci]|uniref:hypothetical protein n=1 Tax=Methanogenium cariaci TaxID=2197 RepID=UPI001FE214E6|nr:hypothetical protein [Methanogenium cariaci]
MEKCHPRLSGGDGGGFLLGEKLLLFATLAQISESIFGAALFTSLQVLWLPLTLHFTGASSPSLS